jgi:hypothetical protein
MGAREHATAAAPPTLPLSQAPDWLLQHLVALVTDGPLEMGITLQVGGLLVSGKLVSGARYFEAAARPLPHYIHLTDTKFFSTAGDPVPAGKGVWWRGRIAEVGGFTLGQLQAQQA